MIGEAELASLKPEAIIVNTSRGPVVDEKALTRTLADRKIFGAGLDVFDQEPPPPDNPLFKLDNVLLAPHSIAWTCELFRDIGRAVCRGMLDLALGRRPLGVLNPEVFDRPGFRRKWERLRVAGPGAAG